MLVTLADLAARAKVLASQTADTAALFRRVAESLTPAEGRMALETWVGNLELFARRELEAAQVAASLADLKGNG